MSIYCAVCGDNKNPKNKTCGKRSCVSSIGWTKSRLEKHKESFNPIKGGAGKRKGVKNKNPYPQTEAVLNRYKQDSINKKQKYNNMSENERKAYYGTNFGSSSEVQARCRAIATENVMKQGTSLKGKFTPKNPEKYIGDHTNIIYRSSWEKRVMEWCDNQPGVKRWCSEEVIIPYISPVDNRRHRYFPDFYVEAVRSDGQVVKMLLEVKPKAQTQEPTVQSRKTKRYITEVVTYGINQAKWKAAEEYCKDKGWQFMIITEEQLFRK